MSTRLSPHMREALTRAISDTGLLVRARGGWWTTEHTPVLRITADGYHVPEWSCTLGTLRALEARGLVAVVPEPGGVAYHYPRIVTDAGRAAVAPKETP